MEITIIGTGNMARGIGTRAVAGGHTVELIGKNREQAEELAAELGGGAGATEKVRGDLIVLAMYYPDALEAVKQHASDIDGKILVDITNPVNDDFSGLVDLPAGSAAEGIAQAAPKGARVVKAFNRPLPARSSRALWTDSGSTYLSLATTKMPSKRCVSWPRAPASMPSTRGRFRGRVTSRARASFT